MIILGSTNYQQFIRNHKAYSNDLLNLAREEGIRDPGTQIMDGLQAVMM